jgi:hypothetical protein
VFEEGREPEGGDSQEATLVAEFNFSAMSVNTGNKTCKSKNCRSTTRLIDPHTAVQYTSDPQVKSIQAGKE